ncbi:MAG: hypothetical protein ACJA1Z_001103 [Patiriisocius sp.]|jgi:hypothetical protein
MEISEKIFGAFLNKEKLNITCHQYLRIVKMRFASVYPHYLNLLRQKIKIEQKKLY